MDSEFWLRFLATFLPIVAFSSWLRTRDFRQWERVVLSVVFAVGAFALLDALRGTLL